MHCEVPKGCEAPFNTSGLRLNMIYTNQNMMGTKKNICRFSWLVFLTWQIICFPLSSGLTRTFKVMLIIIKSLWSSPSKKSLYSTSSPPSLHPHCHVASPHWVSIDKHDIDHRTRHNGKSAQISRDTLFIIWNCVRLRTLAEKQINQDPPVAKENVLLMEIEMKRNSEKPDSSSRRVKKKTIVTGCVWDRISRSCS